MTSPRPYLTAIHRDVIRALNRGAIAIALPTDSHVIVRGQKIEDMRVRRITIDDMTRMGILKRVDGNGLARWTLTR